MKNYCGWMTLMMTQPGFLSKGTAYGTSGSVLDVPNDGDSPVRKL